MTAILMLNIIRSTRISDKIWRLLFLADRFFDHFSIKYVKIPLKYQTFVFI